jgi:hypothetical protein
MRKRLLLTSLLSSLLVACATEQGHSESDFATAVAGTVQAQQAATDVAISIETRVASTVAAGLESKPEAPDVLASPTVTATATATATPTRTNPVISVSANTNCRSGPSAAYDYKGVLMAGETAEVYARSTVSGYWLIANPDTIDDLCWLWDEYASIQGDIDALAEYTPEPSPTPAVDFVLYLNRIQPCGSDTLVHFTLQNTGGKLLMTARIHIVDLITGKDLYGPLLDRHPFSAGPFCPPGHGNRLASGAAGYITAPLKSVPSGNLARATIKACTEDYGGGDCVTKTIDFQIP